MKSRISTAARRQSEDRRRPDHPIAERLDRIVEVALFGAFIFAPLFMGGRGPIGRLVLMTLVAVATVGWFARQAFSLDAKWRWSGAEALIVLGGLLPVLQLIPVSQPMLQNLSPLVAQLLPLWQADSGSTTHLGVWSTASLTPEETRRGLAMFVGYAMLFVVLVQRLHSLEDIERLMKWLAGAAVLMGGLGLLQLVCGNGKFLWLYEHPTRDTLWKVNGAFQNQNHFAHFCALGTGPLIWWNYCLWSASRRPGDFATGASSADKWNRLGLRQAVSVGLGIVLVASLLTFSRGGVLTIATAVSVTMIVYARKKLVGRKALVAVGMFAVLAGVAIGVYGYQPLMQKMGTLASGSLQQVASSRMDLWRAQWDAIPRFAALGAGVGSHPQVYPVFMEQQYDVTFSHGENGYFQLLLETGAAGLVLLLAGFAFVIAWCTVPLVKGKASARVVSLSGAILAGMVASLVHSTCDFVWYIPACVTSTLLLAACACRLFQLNRAEAAANEPLGPAPVSRVEKYRAIPVPRFVAIAATAGMALGALFILRVWIGPALASPHWDAYHRLASGRDRARQLDPATEEQRMLTMERELEETLRRDPRHSRAQLLLTSVKLRRFEQEQKHAENPMGLSQIRDAAIASAFPSKHAQDAWLQVAVGKNQQLLVDALQHCRELLRLSPLEGAGYVYLSELAFLEDPRESAKRDYILQGIRVRPYSGNTLFAMGREYAAQGDVEQAIRYWRKAFNHDLEVQLLIIDTMAGQLPGPLFLTIFEPDLIGMRRLYSRYREQERTADARAVAERLVGMIVKQADSADPVQAAFDWHEAHDLYLWIGQMDQALACQQRAVQHLPQDFAHRRALAAALMHNQRYTEAVEQFEWCLRREPGDDELRQQLAEVRVRQSSPRTAEAQPRSTSHTQRQERL